MTITKSVTDDKIEIVGPYKVLQIRATVVVKEDGEVWSESYHRRVVPPGQDASSETDEIKSLVSLYHTADNIAAYAKHLEDQLP